jgi:hypothetical protein
MRFTITQKVITSIIILLVIGTASMLIIYNGLNIPRAWRCRLPLHYAGAALKEAVGFFRRQEPEWPETIAALVEEARNSLVGRIW